MRDVHVVAAKPIKPRKPFWARSWFRGKRREHLSRADQVKVVSLAHAGAEHGTTGVGAADLDRNAGRQSQLGGHSRSERSQRCPFIDNGRQPYRIDTKIVAPAVRPTVVGQGAEESGEAGVGRVERFFAGQAKAEPAVWMKVAAHAL